MLELFIILSLAMTIRAQMEGYIIGGSRATIKQYPHSAFLGVSCFTDEYLVLEWVCGASILNQMILLTAGHCVHPCRSKGTHITVYLGNDYKKRGILRSGDKFILHENYDVDSNSCDIAIVRMSNPVKLNSMVRRVAVMKKPPYMEPAYLAGWGDTTDTHSKKQSNCLKDIEQRVWNRDSCKKLFHGMPSGTICASNGKRQGYAAKGDSGSALIVRGYIQIGLVSYKVPTVATNVIIYTDIGYYYDWIESKARMLYCSYD